MKKYNLFLRFIAGIMFIIGCVCVGRFAAEENISVEIMTAFISIIMFIIFYTDKEKNDDRH
jgi:ABC-type Fe3+-siderophore transport system permease subunit